MIELMERTGFAVAVVPPSNLSSPREAPHDLLGLPASFAGHNKVIAFAQRDGTRLSPVLFAFPMPDIAALAFDLQDVPRKVSGDPYFKHVLRTVVLVSDAECTAGLTPADIRVLTAAAYLHDALELQRKRTNGHRREYPAQSPENPYGAKELTADLIARHIDPVEAGRIVSLVQALTPPKEGRDVAGDDEYLRYKVEHFREKFTMDHADARLLRILKAGDLEANMEETADDIEHGLDDTRMERPVEIRFRIFRECVDIVGEEDPANPLLPQLRKEINRLGMAMRQSVR